MNFFAIIFGNIIYGITKIISFLFDGFIIIAETIVLIVSNLARGFLALIGMGGCFFLFFLMGPLGWVFLFNPMVIIAILFFIIFPILGTKFVSYLKYRRYMVIEYLFDYSNYLIKGEKTKYGSFREYGNRYKRMEEERKREEYHKKQEQQQKQWEEWFNQQQHQNSQRGQGGFGGWSYGQAGQGRPQGFANLGAEFKNKYEKSCDLLGVSYNTDKYEIKLAYRKKAKEYHPDLNRASNATEIFQKINDAYEFLSDENIERYKKLS